MATISSLLPSTFLKQPAKTHTKAPNPPLLHLKPASFQSSQLFHLSFSLQNPRKTLRISALAQEATATATATADPSSETARRLYVGNIPRDVDNSELTRTFEEHGAVEKAEVMYDKYSGRSRRFAFVTMRTVEDANAAIEKLNGTEIGGREIKVNVTEKPLRPVDMSLFQSEESKFMDSPHKVYVGNLAKTVTTESLTKFFSGRGKVLGARVSRSPGASNSKGFGFVSFSSEKDVEAAILSCNGAFLDRQRIRVNKA
ncbi:hypothetical protein MRB53_006972 [Persea americana]|uniref:Uncharacterized protein n=1 Tax=Persea americana TaxID=3435 RepID=A0ACC2MIQ3_PERAE|nr:hypothetical protein MRB53_006972 [Persea americana]|eukprot:TRINITY_DN1973_c0_g1_i1.p1 TRINITY_DN1973_c0_g1~~TRINITY_DN1973_c0_g1_i1.p1  ORF type:complete len:257 (-),score=39.28 TRINITY_DN1973_c0_g1_i1:237-1007(-)